MASDEWTNLSLGKFDAKFGEKLWFLLQLLPNLFVERIRLGLEQRYAGSEEVVAVVDDRLEKEVDDILEIQGRLNAGDANGSETRQSKLDRHHHHVDGNFDEVARASVGVNKPQNGLDDGRIFV